jgi:hypothetical protein
VKKLNINHFLTDSERYVNMENNYQYFSCRALSDCKGGAAGDKIDRNHKGQQNIRNYKNNEKFQQNILRNSYRKIHQDA